MVNLHDIFFCVILEYYTESKITFIIALIFSFHVFFNNDLLIHENNLRKFYEVNNKTEI